MKEQYTIAQICFYFFWFVVTIGKSFNLSSSHFIMRLCTIIGLVFLILKLFYTKWRKKELVICFFLGLIGMLSFFICKREGAFLTILAIIGLKDIDLKDLLKKTYYIKSLLFFSLIILSFLGIRENTVFEDVRIGENVIKYGFGIGHPNLVHATLFIIICLSIYCNFAKFKIRNYFFWMMANLFLYQFTKSRTGFLVIVFMLTISFIIENKIIYKILEVPIIVFPIILPFVCLGMGYLYSDSTMIQKVSDLLQGRIMWINYCFENIKINLFGTNWGSEVIILDCGYAMILFRYGIVLFLLFLLANFFMIRKFYIEKMLPELVILIGFLVYAVTEEFTANIFLNFSLVFVSKLIFIKFEKGSFYG